MLVLAKYRIIVVVGYWSCRVDGVWRSRIIVLVAAPWLGPWTRLARDLGAKTGSRQLSGIRTSPHQPRGENNFLNFFQFCASFPFSVFQYFICFFLLQIFSNCEPLYTFPCIQANSSECSELSQDASALPLVTIGASHFLLQDNFQFQSHAEQIH
jgi:hypothetical protein